jgi:hypothetical protein
VNALRTARGTAALACLFAAGFAAASQDTTGHAGAAAADTVAPPARVLDTFPFAPGERLTYDVTLGGLGVGKASMAITGWDTVQGHRVMHSLFTVKGGIPFFTVNDVLESWFDPHTMVAYRFIQKIHEGGYHPVRIYELYPDRALYQKQGDTLRASVSDPLDDGSFFYFVRTVPLEVGKTYEFTRYFIPEKNPVIVKVLRRDTITVKAGTFATVVIQPIIKSGGVFADGGEALMWLTDDDKHRLVQMKVKTKIPILNSLNLFLRGIEEHADSAK